MLRYSIIATSYNDARNIDAYMKSIIDFEVQPEELVVVDGGSKDNTEEEIKKYTTETQFDIRTIFDGTRRNISEGYNEAIKQCRSEWILITGIGNTYKPEYISVLINAIEDSKADMAYGPFIGNDVNEFSKIYNKAFLKGNKPFDYGQASNRGVLIHKSVFERCGYFYENFIYAGEDTEFYNRVKEYGIYSVYTEKAIVNWDPPINLQQAMKKTRVNAIADMQLMNLKKLFMKDFLVYVYLFVVLFCCFVFPLVSVLGVTGLCIYTVYKIRCTNIFSIVLWISNLYYTGYQHFKQGKYAEEKYRVKIDKRAE